MGVALRVEDGGPLPAVTWRWEPETDILAGTLRPGWPGPAGTLELNGHDGSVVVLDLTGGLIAGLDVVVWPEVVTVADLAAPPSARPGTIRVIADGDPAAAPVAELDVALAVRASLAEDLIHLRIGAPRPTTVVQIADRFLIELDDGGGLAGFWLSGVPPLLNGEA